MNGVHIGYFENCGDSVETGFVLRPEGAQLDSPGRSPGEPVWRIPFASPNGAQRPSHVARSLRPFRAFGVMGPSHPRAAPWAIESRPFGAQINVA